MSRLASKMQHLSLEIAYNIQIYREIRNSSRLDKKSNQQIIKCHSITKFDAKFEFDNLKKHDNIFYCHKKIFELFYMTFYVFI